MPKCPKCGVDLKRLRFHATYTSQQEVYPNTSDGFLFYPEKPRCDCQQRTYNCPECGEVIGTTKEEALKFFRGK
ncbi:MAG: hypothetical protein PHI12_13380 [Dehalococcoidales bacterium]|nr:hypothetical protein [Dehalococcoidales bacterium]